MAHGAALKTLQDMQTQVRQARAAKERKTAALQREQEEFQIRRGGPERVLIALQDRYQGDLRRVSN